VRACGLRAWLLSLPGRGCTSSPAVHQSLISLLRMDVVTAVSIAFHRQHQKWPRTFRLTLSEDQSRISRSLDRPRVLAPLVMQGCATAMGHGYSSPRFQTTSPTAYSPRWVLHVDSVSVSVAVVADKEERRSRALSSSTASTRAQDQRSPDPVASHHRNSAHSTPTSHFASPAPTSHLQAPASSSRQRLHVAVSGF
jgi:hypothetical protein